LSSFEEQVDADSSFLDAEFADFTLAVDAKVSPEGTATIQLIHIMSMSCSYASWHRYKYVVL